MSVKIQELEDLLEQQRQRASNLEKAKNRLTAELREVTIELENVSRRVHLELIWLHKVSTIYVL